MNVLHEYTLTSMRQNRKTSLSILIAIFLVTMMMSALCGLLFNIYQDNLNLILNHNGDWHGELFDTTTGTDLNVIESFSEVESMMIKGNWIVAKIDDPRRDYLIFRNANADYWNSMPEKDAILEGRIPEDSGEIVLSKQYFEHHPNLQIGDVLSLPIGNRINADGTLITPTDISHDGETFQRDDIMHLTVVGKLDMTTSSSVPAYTALGYLNMDQIQPEDNITVYLRFHDIKKTYDLLPRIAQAIGYQTDEYGDYNIRYNTSYLSRRFVFSAEQLDSSSIIQELGMPLSYLFIGLFTAAVFVLIIHNTFSLSANARLNQIGIFASIGATPKQIRHSILFEAIVLSGISIPLGLLSGQFLIKQFLDFISAKNVALGESPVVFIVSAVSILPSILLTLLTVWWSALIPARQISKMTPITAIRQGKTSSLKKPRRFSFSRLMGIEGELAGNAVHARSRSYRTSVISLLLSFFVLFFMLCALSASNANRKIYRTNGYLREESHIYLSLKSARSPSDREVMKEIQSLKGITQSVWTVSLNAAAWVTPDMLSEEFRTSEGYEKAGKLKNTKYLLERDGKFRLPVVLIGLDHTSFQSFCQELGLNAEEILSSENPSGILLNSIEDVTVSTARNPVYIPYLSTGSGDTLSLTEKRYDDTRGDYSFSVKIAGVTDHYAPIGRRNLTNRYGLILFLPLSQVDAIATSFVQGGIDRVEGTFLTESDADIKPLRAEIERICESWFGSGDYYLNDILDIEENKRNSDQIMNLITGFITILLSIIGLSNIWSTVLGNLNSRRKEFAILRSVGIPPKGIMKMLLLEGLVLGLTPILLCIPLCIAVLIALLVINEISFLQWLPYAPLGIFLLYSFCVLASILSAYVLAAKRILKENIIDAVKQDSI